MEKQSVKVVGVTVSVLVLVVFMLATQSEGGIAGNITAAAGSLSSTPRPGNGPMERSILFSVAQ